MAAALSFQNSTRAREACLLRDQYAHAREAGIFAAHLRIPQVTYAHAREAGIHTGIHEFDGRNTPHPKISARVHHRVGYQAGYH